MRLEGLRLERASLQPSWSPGLTPGRLPPEPSTLILPPPRASLGQCPRGRAWSWLEFSPCLGLPGSIMSLAHLNPFELFTSKVLNLALKAFTSWPQACQALYDTPHMSDTLSCFHAFAHAIPSSGSTLFQALRLVSPYSSSASVSLPSFMKPASCVSHHPRYKAPVYGFQNTSKDPTTSSSRTLPTLS